MENKISRRNFLSAGTLIGGTVVGGSLLTAASSLAGTGPTDLPFDIPKKLKGKTAAALAYDAYNAGKGCCYAAFWGIHGQFIKYGAPYDAFPSDMMTVGGGGVGSWGSICGTLLGCAMAFALYTTGADRSKLVDILFTWYEQTKLPNWKPKTSFRNVPDPKAVAAESINCHMSVSATGLDPGTDAQRERCSRLAGSVSGMAAALLADWHKGKTLTGATLSEVAAYCRGCHGGGVSEAEIVKQLCTKCHDDHTGKY